MSSTPMSPVALAPLTPGKPEGGGLIARVWRSKICHSLKTASPQHETYRDNELWGPVNSGRGISLTQTPHLINVYEWQFLISMPSRTPLYLPCNRITMFDSSSVLYVVMTVRGTDPLQDSASFHTLARCAGVRSPSMALDRSTSRMYTKSLMGRKRFN